MLDYEALPPQRAAALFCGLRDDARIKLSLAGAKAGTDRILLAAIVDRLGLLLWPGSGERAPASVVEALCGAPQRRENGVQSFRDGAAFEAARAKIAGEVEAWRT